MPVPVISSQQLSDYAITTEEPTVATAVITNSPTLAFVFINNRSFRMMQYSGTTYRADIYGYQTGTVTASAVTFLAYNGTGASAIATAGSTLTVTKPTRGTYGIQKVIDRLIYLLKNSSEYGGDNISETYNVVSDFSDELMNGQRLVKPVIWIRGIRETVEAATINDIDDTINVLIQFTVIDNIDNTTKMEKYYKVDSAIRYMIRANPNLQIADDAFLIDTSTVQGTRFPTWENGYFMGEMNIDVLFRIDQRS